ncbi:hypothetical protein FDZ71_08075 [bacterium]|nr:MAG: hypothetical protein FDZ71_08075 [bacterium]
MSLDWLKSSERETALFALADRFGIPVSAFDGYALYKKGDHISAVRSEAVEADALLHAQEGGIPLLKTGKGGVSKPATAGILVFGVHATKAVADLSSNDLKGLAEGRSLPAGEGKGYVIVRVDGVVAGMALLRDGRMVGQIPKWVTENLKMSGRESFATEG